MGWGFDEPTWNAVTGAYYTALGAEALWVGLSIVCCVVALIFGSMHEKAAYRREQDRNGR
ncbi:MAG: hypothetical protein AAFV19_19070 [Pseudomonadota bacterium]